MDGTDEHVTPRLDPADIKGWRKQTRTQLLERRLAINARVRLAKGDRVKARVLESIDLGAHRMLGIYWPFRGEIDVRDLARQHIEAGGEVALPVVVQKAAPLEFWRWRPEMKMQRGVWNIPIPPQRDVVRPDALLIPLVGFDRAGFRLGYGGGYYDRTLAAAPSKPLCIGLGYVELELETIHPQPHDVPMDWIVTDQFIRSVDPASAR